MQKSAGKAYAVSFGCYLVMAAAMDHLLNAHLKVGSVHEGLVTGALLWVGFVATVGLTAHMFSERRFVAYVIDAGYQLVYLLMMGAIVAAWR